MKTFLLYWNPHFSNYKVERFLDDFDFSIKDVLTQDDAWDRSPDDFDWSVFEYKKAHTGDRFVFVRVGYEKPTGIIGIGTFSSEPYVDEDWSGQGRKTYYMKMEWETVVNPASDKVLRTSELITSIPEVVWDKGHSGVEVAPEVADKIEKLWEKHIASLK